MSGEQTVLDCLDREACGINLTGLVQLLPDLGDEELKRLTAKLYAEGRINRIPVMGPNKRYYVFYSLYVRTANGYVAPAEPAPAPAADALSPEQASRLIARLEQDVAAPERRVAPLGALEVIDRWKLPYRLSRVIEILASTRRRNLTHDEAALAARLIREQAGQ